MNWKRLRKPVAIIAALALVVGLFPAYAVADSVGGDGGGTAAANAANDKGAVNDNGTEPASGEKAPAGKEQTPATGEKAVEEGQALDSKAPLAAKGDTRNAGGEYAISIYYNSAQGTVTATVDGVETASADGGDLVYLTITPASGYSFSSSGVTVTNSDGESVRTVPQSDGTVSFQMPNSRATVSVAFTADASEPDGLTPIEAATINIAVPEAGSSNVDAEAIVSVPDSAHYSIRSAYWVTGDSSSVTIDRYSGTLEAGQNYALTIVLKADSGYMFQEADDASGTTNGTFAVVGDGASVNGDNQIRVDNTTGYVEKPDGTWVETVTESEGWTNVLITPTSRDTVNMRIWTLGHGKILVNGSDYGSEFEGTWYEGAEVEIEAVPDDGYKFGRWWIQKNPGPNAIVEDAVTTLVAGTDLAANVTFGLETAYVTITPPVAGDTAATAPQISVPSGAGYGLDASTEFFGPNTMWVKSASLYNPEILEASTVFEAGQTYYAYVRLADGEDSFAAMAGGSTFNTDLNVTGGTNAAQGNFAATSAGGDTYMGIEAIIAVTIPTPNTHTVTFDTDGHYSPAPQNQEVTDGEKATRPAHPAADERASDYSTTGLSFHGWYTKPANEISSYWEFCYTKRTNDAGCIFDFNEPITQDTTAYAVYEGVLTIKAYDVTNGVEQVGGTFDHSNYNYSTPSSASSVQTFAFYNMPEFLKAKPAEGYKFAGWSTSTSKDDIISEDAEFEYTFTQRATLYALFEVEAQDPTLTVTLSSMTFGPSGTPSAPVTDLLESLTVNGEEWELSEAINPFDPSGSVYLIGSKPVPAGAQVTAVVKPTLTGMVISADHPDVVSDFETSMSADYTMTITFTMPDSDIGLGAALTLAAPVTFDANNGTPGGDWPEGNVTKIYILIAAQGKKLTVPETPDSDGVMGEGAVEPPADSVFAGIEITDDNGTKTYKPGDETDLLVFTKGLTIKYLWAKDVTVTFDAKGGTPVPDAQTFTAGGKATEPEAPAKGDWSFAEWYTDESYESSCLFGFDNPVAEDTTLYARWNGRLTVAAFDKTNDEPGGGSFDCETISGTVESADLYTVGTVAEGTPFALTAKPAEGYRFVGWAKGSADGEVVSDKERYEPAAGFDETNLEFYAVFERIPVTVTFDTEGGIPEVGQQDLYYGDKATQPASDATGKSGWNFAGWYTEDGQLFDFNTAITEDTTLHAKWRGTIGFFSINDSEERLGGGGKITIDAEEITSVKYVMVNENDALTATAIPENGYVFVGWAILGNNEFPFHNWTIDSTNATETFTAASQPMTVCAVFKEKPPVLTLHASSVEGDDFIDPIEIEVVKGATIAQALEQYAAGTSLASKLFQKEGYQDKGYRTPKPMGDYVSYSELWGATVSGDTVLEGDFDLYYSMVKEIDAIELDIEAPVCGTSTDVPEGAYWWEDQTNPPKVSTSGENYTLDNEDGFLPAVWIISADNDNPYKGDFVGGEEYFAEVWCIPNFGYTFAEDASVTVNGGECVEPLYDGNWFGAYVKVVAAHDPAEAVEENVAAPTCTEAGSHDEAMYCNACGAEVSRETIEDAALGHDWGEWTQTKAPTCTEPGEEARECGRCDETETHEVDALGHDWGEWEVVKEATGVADGLEQRTCARCGEVEERVIPSVGVEYRCVAGDGATYTLGSGDALAFIFKRNVKDDSTFSHFKGVLVDGVALSADQYDAKPGSVMLTFAASYLDTLAAGSHTLMAQFDDGTATAAFTVKEGVAPVEPEEETTPAEEKAADKAASDESKESPKTGDTLPMGAVGLTAIAAAAALAFAWRKRRA